VPLPKSVVGGNPLAGDSGLAGNAALPRSLTRIYPGFPILRPVDRSGDRYGCPLTYTEDLTERITGGHTKCR
jgi:hypothetical protein